MRPYTPLTAVAVLFDRLQQVPGGAGFHVTPWEEANSSDLTAPVRVPCSQIFLENK